MSEFGQRSDGGTYEIRVAGRLGPALLAAFTGMQAEVVSQRVVLRGWVSRPQLSALIRRLDELGLQVESLRAQRRPSRPVSLPGPRQAGVERFTPGG